MLLLKRFILIRLGCCSCYFILKGVVLYLYFDEDLFVEFIDILCEDTIVNNLVGHLSGHIIFSLKDNA